MVDKNGGRTDVQPREVLGDPGLRATELGAGLLVEHGPEREAPRDDRREDEHDPVHLDAKILVAAVDPLDLAERAAREHGLDLLLVVEVGALGLEGAVAIVDARHYCLKFCFGFSSER